LLSSGTALKVGTVLLALVVATNVGRIGKVIYESRSPDFYLVTEGQRIVDYFDLAGWFRKNCPGQAVVVAHENRLLQYFGGVRAHRITSVIRPSGGDVAACLERAGVQYIVRDREKDSAQMKLVDRLMRSNPRAFERVGRFGKLELFRVDPDMLGETVGE